MTLVQTLAHFGPTIAAAFVLWWIAYRYGQLAQPSRARWLPLTCGPAPKRLARGKTARRPYVLVSLAVIVGIAIGVPLATAVMALRADGIHSSLHGVDH